MNILDKLDPNLVSLAIDLRRAGNSLTYIAKVIGVNYAYTSKLLKDAGAHSLTPIVCALYECDSTFTPKSSKK